MIISSTSEANVAAAAERFRAAVADATTAVDPALHLSVTISIGGAVSTARAPHAALHAADAALYDAKLSGRNRVVIHRDGPNDPVPTKVPDPVEPVVSRR